MKELIRIDFEKGELKTQLHTYTVTESLPVDKYIQFLNLQSEVAYGISFDEINKKHKEIHTALNKTDFVQSAALLHNLMYSINNGIEKRKLPILKLCALFLIREDEDNTVFNEAVNNEKIDEFTNGGIQFTDFFYLAAIVVPGLLDALNEISRTISETMKQAEKQLIKTGKKLSGSKKLKPSEIGNKQN